MQMQNVCSQISGRLTLRNSNSKTNIDPMHKIKENLADLNH